MRFREVRTELDDVAGKKGGDKQDQTVLLHARAVRQLLVRMVAFPLR